MYYLIYAFFWLITLLPIQLLYGFTNLLYYLIYYIVGYRRKVVRRNISNAFPEKSLNGIKEIERKFYRFFSDIFIETFAQIHFSKAQISKRMTYKNVDIITDQYAKNKSVMLMTAHYGNWEWYSSLAMVLPPDKTFYGVYKQLSNRHMDRLIQHLRTKFGGGSIESQSLYKTMLRMKADNKLGAFIMVADQRPFPTSSRHWMTFMNQDTPVFIGTEQLAKKFDYPVVLMNVKRLKRGYYCCEFEMIAENPKACANNEITEKYIHLLEQKINKNPEYWLWTHNRWKHKRPVE